MFDLPPPGLSDPPFGRSRHPYFMHEMIRRQAVAARGTFRAVSESLAATPLEAPSGRLLTVGLGTSFHAALGAACAGGPLLRGRCQVEARTSFDLLEDPDAAPPGSTALVFSAGGETALTMKAQEMLRARRVRVLLITSHEAGPSSGLADRVLVTQYADETSWTHTVSFTSALVATAALYRHWTGVAGTPEPAEDDIAEMVTAALASEPRMLDLVESLAGRDQFVFLGSGFGEVTAREAALKFREAAGRFSAAVGIEEFLHGVIPSVDDHVAVVGISSTPVERTRALEGLVAARLAGARTFLIDSSGAPAGDGELSVRVGPPLFPPALQIIPLQLLAYWLAVSEGRNPDVMGLDEPRILAARKSFGI